MTIKPDLSLVLPDDLGRLHFVGIGGIGMSGIAEVMHHLGYKVQGSDRADSYVTQGLRKAGIPVMIGQDADNLGDAAVLVCSTAIRDDNPEVKAAAERRIQLAEQQAAQEVKAAAADLAARMAETVLARRVAEGGPDPLIDRGIDQVAARLQ